MIALGAAIDLGTGPMPLRVLLVVGTDGTVRGFPYLDGTLAREARSEADLTWPAAAPHRLQPYAPEPAP